MAGRGMLFADGPSACPFVALESDRDRRAAEPDPRHRCYAEPLPAPRALAHQREFCLTPGFPRCPIFQDWAVRAAARPVPLRPLAELEDAPPHPGGAQQLPAFGETIEPERPAVPARPSAGEQPSLPARPVTDHPLIPPPVYPPVTPPATAAPGAAGERAGRSIDPVPVERIPSLPNDPAASRPAADQVAQAAPPAVEPPEGAEHRPRRPRWTDDWPPSAAAAISAGDSPAAQRATLDERARPSRPGPDLTPPAPHQRSQIEVGRPIRPSRGRPEPRPASRDEWSAQRADLIPAWERERYSAYPGLRARIGLNDGDALIDRLTRVLGIIAIVALVIAVLILLPGFFAGGPTGAPPTATPSASASGPTASPPPTITPQPTVSFTAYAVKPNDSLSGIAVEFGILPCQILAANPQITDPNLIQIGQVIQIPPDDFQLEECLASPTT